MLFNASALLPFVIIEVAEEDWTSAVAEPFYTFFRVKKTPTIAPIRIIGANLKNSHSNA